jgi:hypothetical protein
MVESQVRDVALELLKRMDELQAKGSEEALVNPYEVARHVEGLGLGSQFYNYVVNYLVGNGAIERDEWATQGQVDTTFYRITRHGFEILNGEARLR